jgi:hypothetical protein
MQHYEWKAWAFDGVGKYCLEGLLSVDMQDAMFSTLDALSDVVSYKVLTDLCAFNSGSGA